jgi:hypothetical protein
MADKTIPLPLSGSEVKAAILDKISQALDKDCYLHESAAYGWFEAHIKLEIRCDDLGREDVVKADLTATEGEKPEELPESVRVELQIDKAPPNQVRVETGQAVPTESGKRIKYGRKIAEKTNS